jgi:aspartate aminotransferase
LTITTTHPIRFARRVTDIQVSPTIAVMNRAGELIARGIDVVDFGPGEPDFTTPLAVCAAAHQAIDEGLTKYTNAMGTAALRDAIAERYNGRYGARVRSENVIAGTGGKQELFNVVLSLVSEGDEVIIPAPYWVSFPDQVLFAGGKPVFVETTAANHFRPTAKLVEAAVTDRTRGVILNSPCNPTGAVIREEELRGIVELCHARGIFLMFDETYELFVYEGNEHVSAIRWFDNYPETVIVVNSMSKTFAMTGWRLGYAIAHPSIIAAMGKIQSHSTTNPSSISQAAALAALRGGDGEAQKMWEAYAERRAWLVPALNAIDGIECDAPDGAFYVWPNVSALYGRGRVTSSASFATYLLDEALVAVVPGSAFGQDDHIRISYATSMERIEEGVRRIGEAVRKLA